MGIGRDTAYRVAVVALAAGSQLVASYPAPAAGSQLVASYLVSYGAVPARSPGAIC